MEEMILDLIPEIKNTSEDYISSVIRKYNMFIDYSQIPSTCYGFNDKSIIPDKLNKLYNNIYTAVQGRYNILINFKNYQNVNYLIYLFMQEYFRYCIANDLLVENILYIDTKLMVEDYKRLMNFEKNESALSPVHSLDTLYSSIENAPFLVWDKFMLVDSAYDKDKIFDIINIRNRKGLGNLYISAKDVNLISKIMGPNILGEMNVDVAFECVGYNLDIKSTKEVNIFK